MYSLALSKAKKKRDQKADVGKNNFQEGGVQDGDGATMLAVTQVFYLFDFTELPTNVFLAVGFITIQRLWYFCLVFRSLRVQYLVGCKQSLDQF